MNEDLIKRKLIELVDEVNHSTGSKLCFHQQGKTTANMSLSGGNGRIWVQPTAIGYDISLSGQSLERELYGFMSKLYGKECDGYKQPNATKGLLNQPFWRSDDWAKLKIAIQRYSESSV